MSSPTREEDEARALLKEHEASMLRKTGASEIWRFPDGQQVTIPAVSSVAARNWLNARADVRRCVRKIVEKAKATTSSEGEVERPKEASDRLLDLVYEVQMLEKKSGINLDEFQAVAKERDSLRTTAEALAKRCEEHEATQDALQKELKEARRVNGELLMKVEDLQKRLDLSTSDIHTHIEEKDQLRKKVKHLQDSMRSLLAAEGK